MKGGNRCCLHDTSFSKSDLQHGLTKTHTPDRSVMFTCSAGLVQVAGSADRSLELGVGQPSVPAAVPSE